MMMLSMKPKKRSLFSWLIVFLCLSAVVVQGQDGEEDEASGSQDEEVQEYDENWFDQYNQYNQYSRNYDYYQDFRMAYVYRGFRYSGCSYEEGFEMSELYVSCGENGIMCEEGDVMTISGRFSTLYPLPHDTYVNVKVCKWDGATCSSSIINYETDMCNDFGLEPVDEENQYGNPYYDYEQSNEGEEEEEEEEEEEQDQEEENQEEQAWNEEYNLYGNYYYNQQGYEYGVCPNGGNYSFFKQFYVPTGMLDGFIHVNQTFTLHMKVRNDNNYGANNNNLANLNCRIGFEAIEAEAWNETRWWLVHNYTRYFASQYVWDREDYEVRLMNYTYLVDQYLEDQEYEEVDYSYAYASMGLVAVGLTAFGVNQRRRRRRRVMQPALDISSDASNGEATTGFEMMGSDSVRV